MFYYTYISSQKWDTVLKYSQMNQKHEKIKNIQSMWNTMDAKRDNFSGALGGARETHWERVSHALKDFESIYFA